MAKFARIIDIDNDTQLLILVEYNSSTDKYEFIMQTDLEGVQIKSTLEMNSEEQAYIALEDFSFESAINFVNNLKDSWLEETSIEHIE